MSGEFWTAHLAVQWLAGIGVRKAGAVTPRLEKVIVGEDGVQIPKAPHRLLVVTDTPGPGEMLDGAAETVGFQARLRWTPGDQRGAQQAALAIHRAITRASFPTTVGDCRLIFVSGSRPVPLGRADDDGNRTTYVGTYLPLVAEFDGHEQE